MNEYNVELDFYAWKKFLRPMRPVDWQMKEGRISEYEKWNIAKCFIRKINY